MGYGKKNKVSLNPLDYNICLLGESKIGKSTLANEVCKKLLGEDGYLMVEIGNEAGADAIEGAMYINTPVWWQEYDEIENSVGFGDLVDDILENKTEEYPNLKMVIFDTYDQLIKIAEEETIRLYNKHLKEQNKPIVKSINSAWGGYGKGEKYAMQLIDDLTAKLNRVGVRVFTIGHTKQKDVTDILTNETYQVLTSDSQSNYFNNLKKSLHFLALAFVDREIIKEKSGKKDKDGKDKMVGKVTKEARKIKFRDDGYAVDSGSRFANIIPEIPMDADAFIEALTDAIKAEISKNGNDLSSREKEQKTIDKRKEEKAKKEVEKNRADKKSTDLNQVVGQIVDFIRDNKDTPNIWKPILNKIKDYGYSTPSDINNIEIANEIWATCEELNN